MFPMSKASFSIPPLSSLNGDMTAWTSGAGITEDIELQKTGSAQAGTIDISQIFQYGMTNGFPDLIQSLERITFALHGKPYTDAKVYLGIGSLDSKSPASPRHELSSKL